MAPSLDQHNYHDFDATILADSIGPSGDRITSMVITFCRSVLAEFNTHRMFSRNSASSRAIPAKRMISDVSDFPFVPLDWMKSHRGMQGTEYHEEREELDKIWLHARDCAVDAASCLAECKVTKQMSNRLLEPFKWHTVIVTATEWGNFFALRAEKSAEIHIARLAEIMLQTYNSSKPRKLAPGEWHIPFGDRMDENSGTNNDNDQLFANCDTDEKRNLLKIKIATARCARVSYENFEGTNNYQKDVALHDSLIAGGHWSPFEHCARTMNNTEYELCVRSSIRDDNIIIEKGWLGNFRGFIQYRKLFSEENRTDERLTTSC